VIEKYTKDGVIDYAGLARYLQRKKNTKLAAGVMNSLKRTIETSKPIDGGSERTYNVDMSQVNSLLDKMTSRNFLRRLEKYVYRHNPDRLLLNAIHQRLQEM
jgi:hypothetical protein